MLLLSQLRIAYSLSQFNLNSLRKPIGSNFKVTNNTKTPKKRHTEFGNDYESKTENQVQELWQLGYNRG